MDKLSRRQLVRDYKERKVPVGIFAVRCAATGETWVGVARNLESQKNATWFQFKAGGHPNKALQAAWATHGDDAFSYEALETVDDKDLTPLGRDELLKRRQKHWLEALGAVKIVG